MGSPQIDREVVMDCVNVLKLVLKVLAALCLAYRDSYKWRGGDESKERSQSRFYKVHRKGR